MASAASSAGTKPSGRSRSQSALPIAARGAPAAHLDVARAPVQILAATTEQEQSVAALGEPARDRARPIPLVAPSTTTFFRRVSGAGLCPAELVAGGFGNPPRVPIFKARP